MAPARATGVTGIKLAAPRAPTATARRTTLFLDLTDLLLFLKNNAHLTGIQRVQVGIGFNLLTGDVDLARLGVSTDRVVFVCHHREKIVSVSSRDLVRLVDDIQSKDLERSQIDWRLNQMLTSAKEIKPELGDLYVILGAYWFGDQYFHALSVLKGEGCRIGVFIHDLIPMTNPEFVDEGTRRAMLNQLADILVLSDFVLTNSEFVAREVRRVLREEMQTEKPVFPVPLSHELPPLAERTESASSSVLDMLPKEFVLCVGTIEGRKNHLFLVNVWETLLRKHGGAIPTLVIVGKWGWRFEEFRRQLEAGGYVDGHVVILEGVSDAALRELYANCLFTVFPSFAEGWGLPVGESLACGKPCITSNATALPEVGGDFCRYFDPYDVSAGVTQIERVIKDRKDLQSWTERVRTKFQIRTWAEVAGIFFNRLIEVTKVLTDAPSTAELVAGRVNALSAHALAEASWSDRSVKFIFSTGWWPLENWGCWSSRALATLNFAAVGAEPGSTVTVWMQLRLPEPPSEEYIMITDEAGLEETVRLAGTHAQWVAVDSTVDPDGSIRLKLRRLGSPPPKMEARALYFGLCAIAFHPKRNFKARLDVMESIVTLV